METISIIKVGGAILEDQDKREEFIRQFLLIEGKKILIHGGGRDASKIMSQMGHEAVIVEGRRVTDANTLKIVTMVYGGLINKNLVAMLQTKGCNAIGLCGADGKLVTSTKRQVKNNIDYGFVGDVKLINSNLLSLLCNYGLVPVIAPLSFNPEGTLLNTNADTIASEIAISLSEKYSTRLIYCFEKNGLLADVSNENSMIKSLNSSAYLKLKQNGNISGGMIPKIDNCFHALTNGVKEVCITKSPIMAGTQISL